MSDNFDQTINQLEKEKAGLYNAAGLQIHTHPEHYARLEAITQRAKAAHAELDATLQQQQQAATAEIEKLQKQLDEDPRAFMDLSTDELSRVRELRLFLDEDLGKQSLDTLEKWSYEAIKKNDKSALFIYGAELSRRRDLNANRSDRFNRSIAARYSNLLGDVRHALLGQDNPTEKIKRLQEKIGQIASQRSEAQARAGRLTNVYQRVRM